MSDHGGHGGHEAHHEEHSGHGDHDAHAGGVPETFVEHLFGLADAMTEMPAVKEVAKMPMETVKKVGTDFMAPGGHSSSSEHHHAAH